MGRTSDRWLAERAGELAEPARRPASADRVATGCGRASRDATGAGSAHCRPAGAWWAAGVPLVPVARLGGRAGERQLEWPPGRAATADRATDWRRRRGRWWRRGTAPGAWPAEAASV